MQIFTKRLKMLGVTWDLQEHGIYKGCVFWKGKLFIAYISEFCNWGKI